MRNIFEEMQFLGHDRDFVPRDISELRSTDAVVGSRRKLEVMAERVQLGLPMFHPDDSSDYGDESGERAAYQQRKKKAFVRRNEDSEGLRG